MTPFKQFYNKPISERRQILEDNYGLEDADLINEIKGKIQ